MGVAVERTWSYSVGNRREPAFFKVGGNSQLERFDVVTGLDG